ncbi:hypothetical protein [Clavibacter capsici]|uniref:hypothetical protein n=1 Tax=Clavibacter capsici TaxID=1874630 RepID=UPI0014282401|nr:hypothetical protein [Clavibacter capsici]QIS38643.1 hypothetical protein GW572_04520 [Clavibacter capsici]
MAIINLRNVEVTRLNQSGNGFSVVEQNTSGDKTYKTFFKVWADGPHGLDVGARINVSGFLNSKVGDPKTGTDNIERRYVEHSINQPRIETANAGTGNAAPNASTQAPFSQPQPTSYTQPGGIEPWVTSAPDSELPF